MLSVHDIANGRYERVINNHDHYKEILSDIMFQIKEVNESSHSQNWMVYELPFLNSQHSLYNVEHAKKYIITKLQKLGYKVESYRDKIKIDWSVVNELVQRRIDHKKDPSKRRKEHPDAWRFK